MQSEWAFAVREVEENPLHHTTIPRLELRGPGGRRVIAKDVLMWRVDSLEGTPIGQACLFRDWEVLVSEQKGHTDVPRQT
jgi:hypothetical protein